MLGFKQFPFVYVIYIYIQIYIYPRYNTHTHIYTYYTHIQYYIYLLLVVGDHVTITHSWWVILIHVSHSSVRPCPSRPCPSRARRQWSWQRRLQCRLCTLDGRWSPSSIRMAGAWYQVWIQENTPQEIVPCQPLSLSLSLLCNIDNNVNSQVHQFITGITLW